MAAEGLGWRKLAVGLALLLGVACDRDFLMYGPGAKVTKAEQRVASMLDGMSTTPTGRRKDPQLAVCRWYDGSRMIYDRDRLGYADVKFTEWCNQRGIYEMKLDKFEILDSAVCEGVTPDTVIVTVSLNGRRYELRVPDSRPISWQE